MARDARPLLLQSPSVSKTRIAFTYGGDVWIVDRSGADAHRPEFGPLPDPGNLAFIEAHGSLRLGHQVYNEF